MHMPRQITDTVLMVRPASFGFNTETAQDNAFQQNDTSLNGEQIQAKAREEFDELVRRLREVGVEVIVVEDTTAPRKTDAIFPNNWISFHDDGLVITYPMYSPIRRLERRRDVIERLEHEFSIERLVRLEGWEERQMYLEGTGSMILDRPNGILYACRSVRTNGEALDEFAEMMDFEPVTFTATDREGQAIYHTNVMMALGETFCVICLDSIRNPNERELVINTLMETNKAIIDISLDQMHAFAGNMLQVRGREGAYLVMSEQAFQSLTPRQVAQLEKHTRLLHSPLYTIERYGGGSARCMLAEVFLPRR